SFEQAQVTAGGVSMLEVEKDSLESKKKKGIYFTGELLDVDGTCGGYNLQWAFSSAYAVGMNAGRK
ncbi:MAG: NAD(P)/FAD-dependent oxidoreductase, partial [Acetivibrio sp.]